MGPGGGLSTGNFERWMKGALGMEHLSLKKLCGEGLGGGSCTGDPGRYIKKGSRYGHPLHGGPFTMEGNLESGGGPIYWGL